MRRNCIIETVTLFCLDLEEHLKKGHFYVLDNNNSEDIAAYLHFFLTVTPYDVSTKDNA